MAKPRAGSSAARPAAAARATPVPTSSDPNLPTPTSIPRADVSSFSSSSVKPAAASANRSSVGSSSSAPASADLPAPAASHFASVAKEVGKRLAYDDGDDLPTVVQQLELVPEGLADLAPLLDLPDPDVAAVSAPAADVTTASARSTVTQVAPLADSTLAATADAEAPVPLTEMELVLAELRGARGLSPRSKRLLAALAETASAELDYNPTAAVLRTRRAAFWRKVRVGVLAAMVFSVAAIDVALAVALFGARRGNGRNGHVLPPT